MRSINNVVDATNYVMFELNQPMHAYDLAKLRGGALVVRRARRGERLVTLDDVERPLTPEMVAIADGEGVIGVAGVMGGANTEVSAETPRYPARGGLWDPAAPAGRGATSTSAPRRATASSAGSTAGAARPRCAAASSWCWRPRAATLVEPPVDLWPAPSHPPRIFLRPARVAQVLGVELPWHELERHLVAIGATVVSKPEDGRIAVDVPGWRPDLQREIDLIEEIARLHGYDSFPSDLRPFRVGTLPDAPEEAVTAAVRRGLVAEGFYEVVSLPHGRRPTATDSVRLLNPLAADEAWLRRRLLPGLVRLVEANWANRVADVRLFEIGTAFAAGAPGERPARGAPGGRGADRPAGAAALDRHRRRRAFDLWDLKGRLEAAVALAIPEAEVQVEGQAWVVRDRAGRVVGSGGPLAADAPPWAAPLFGFELLLDPAPRRPAPFAPLPTTPSSERVLALLLPEGVRARQVEDVLRRAGGALLERVDIESDYRGAELPAGTRSVAFRLTFRAPDRTLRDTEVDEAEARLLAALAAELGIQRRDGESRTGG